MLLNSKCIITPATVLNNNYIITQVTQMSIKIIPDVYTGQNFNKTIYYQFRGVGIDPLFLPSALSKPRDSNQWTINLPDIPAEKWKQPNFRLIIHAQDFVHWYNNELCTELFWIEQQFTEEQQCKIIFLHWDHSLKDYYEGYIQCVEFPSHSYELVHFLKERWNEWKDVHNKDIKYNWICLNGHPRPHRNQLYQRLQNQPSGFCTHGLHNPAPMAPYFSTYGWNNVDNFINLMPLYQQAKASIVSETIYADHPGIITEKTLLAIAAKHPFMAIGHIGIHKELAERGFENFDELFDLNYDDDRKDIRLNNALDLNWHNIIDPDWDVESALEKAERNFDFLINDYTRNIERRSMQQLQTAMKKSYY